MKLKNILLIIIICANTVISQEDKKTDSFTIINDVDILNTPRFYRSYFSEFNLNNNWLFRMEMLERNNNNLFSSYTLIEYPLLAKYKINNKFRILFGPKINIMKIDGNIDNVSIFSTFGVQYDINESFSLYGRTNLNLNPSQSLNNNYLNNSIYEFGTKLKF